jgi:hypothetical protein
VQSSPNLIYSGPGPSNQNLINKKDITWCISKRNGLPWWQGGFRLEVEVAGSTPGCRAQYLFCHLRPCGTARQLMGPTRQAVGPACQVHCTRLCAGWDHIHSGPSIIHIGLGPTNQKLILKTKIARGYMTRLSIAWWQGNHIRVERLRVWNPACALYFATYIGPPMWDSSIRSAGALCGTPLSARSRLSGRWGRAVGSRCQ